MHRVLFLLSFAISYNLIFAQNNLHFENILATGDPCMYYVPDSDIGRDWILPDFNDASWLIGTTGIGYSDDDDNTLVPTGTYSVYIRQEFTVSDPADLQYLILDIDYDDGFIAYLNGTEVSRANVLDPVSWDMSLLIDHEALMYSGGLPERFIIDENQTEELLVAGKNVLAVEVHNVGPGSSDMSSNIFLHAYINSATTIFRDLPEWFWEPVVYASFNLPLMVINTNGQTIYDEPRIVADMGLIWNGDGSVNNVNDEYNIYSGKISIETRGESSQGFDKKSYSIELQNADGTNNNVSLLGLPAENDFVLYGPYSDKTMIRNVLTYQLYNHMGRWAPHTRYMELIINDDYKGVYVLVEKVKIDNNRVDIHDPIITEESPEDISGGYILRRDKLGGVTEEEYWTSPVDQIYYEQMVYQYFDPEYGELNNLQRQYIKDWMKEFDEMMSGPSFADREFGYWSYMDVGSFIDMLILNEFSKEVDVYLFSTYFHKQNIREGGKLVAGPPWDYNLSYGSIDYGQNENIPYYYDWMYNHWGRVYWYNRLMEDEVFRNKVYCRWEFLRKSYFSDEYIQHVIDSCVSYLGPAVDRNFNRFPILGIYVWPNRYTPATYEEEIENLRSWIKNRLEWMDDNWYGQCVIEPIVLSDYTPDQNEQSVRVFPNPSDFSDIHFYIDTESEGSELTIELFDINGRLVEQINRNISNVGQQYYRLSDYSTLPDGVYMIRVIYDSGKIYTTSLVKSSKN